MLLIILKIIISFYIAMALGFFILIMTGNYNVKYTNNIKGNITYLTGIKKILACLLIALLWIFTMERE